MIYIYNNKDLLGVRRKLRRNQTRSEKRLWRYLRNRKLGVKFYRQYSIGRYVADFCCPSKKLVIEIDGITHDIPEVIEKDIRKQKFIERLGFKVVRLSDCEVREFPEEIAEYIRYSYITPPNPS